MNYEYKFNIEECWYKQVCPLFNTEECCGNCIRFQKMHFLATNALLTKKQQQPIKLWADNIDKDAYIHLNEIKKNIVEFVKNEKNLLIYSKTVGCGKTSWSLKILMSYFDKIWPATDFVVRGLFINVPRFLNELKEDIRETSDYIQHIKENILQADLVIWDELGTKSPTEFEQSYLLSYINARLDNGKSNIFTSNMNTVELEQLLGARLFSRVVNASDVVEFKGADKRGMK